MLIRNGLTSCRQKKLFSVTTLYNIKERTSWMNLHVLLKWLSFAWSTTTTTTTTTSSSSSSSFYDSSHIRPLNFSVLLIGLEKYLNSSLPLGQIALTYCSSGAFSHLSKFSNSLIIHEPKKWKSFTHVFECNNLSDLLVTFLVLITFICCFLNYALSINVESLFSIRYRTGLCATSWTLPNSKTIILKGSA